MNTVMTQVVTVMLTFVFTAQAAAVSAQSKPVVVYTVDYLKPPETLHELWNLADAVVRVTVENSNVMSAQHPLGSAPGRVFTMHGATITETLKPDSRLVLGSGSLKIIQAAGELDTNEKVIRVQGGYAPFLKGDDYVLFLEWNGGLQAFEVMFGPSATLRLKDGHVETPAVVGPALTVRGLTVEALLTLLRALR